MGGFRYLADALATQPVSLAARLAVAAMFAAAGLYKLRHPLIAATSAVNFRVAGRTRRAVGLAIGGAETTAAVLVLVPVPVICAAGCVTAIALAITFALVIARALHSGEHFACHCLPGSDDDISAATLWRALALAAGAGIALAGPAAGHELYPVHALLPGAGIAMATVGIPAAVHAAAGIWHRYRSFVADVDWAWVIASREGRVWPTTGRTDVD